MLLVGVQPGQSGSAKASIRCIKPPWPCYWCTMKVKRLLGSLPASFTSGGMAAVGGWFAGEGWKMAEGFIFIYLFVFFNFLGGGCICEEVTEGVKWERAC